MLEVRAVVAEGLESDLAEAVGDVLRRVRVAGGPRHAAAAGGIREVAHVGLRACAVEVTVRDLRRGGR